MEDDQGRFCGFAMCHQSIIQVFDHQLIDDIKQKLNDFGKCDFAMTSRNVFEIFNLSNTLQTINNIRGSIMLGRGDFFFFLWSELPD